MMLKGFITFCTDVKRVSTHQSNTIGTACQDCGIEKKSEILENLSVMMEERCLPWDCGYHKWNYVIKDLSSLICIAQNE